MSRIAVISLEGATSILYLVSYFILSHQNANSMELPSAANTN